MVELDVEAEPGVHGVGIAPVVGGPVGFVGGAGAGVPLCRPGRAGQEGDGGGGKQDGGDRGKALEHGLPHSPDLPL